MKKAYRSRPINIIVYTETVMAMTLIVDARRQRTAGKIQRPRNFFIILCLILFNFT